MLEKESILKKLKINDKFQVYCDITNKLYDIKNHYHIGESHQLKPHYDWIINPVGQIVEVGERKEIKRRFCSGFNIGDGYFLTAGHCLSQDNVCYLYDPNVNVNGLAVTFDFAHSHQFVENFSPIRVVDHGHCNVDFNYTITYGTTDYAVFQLNAQSINYGAVNLTLNKPAVNNQDVVLSHHPAGTPKKISFGKIKTIDDKTINHSAFTLGGSSGCPIALENSREVVAVHVAGSTHNGTKVPDQIHHFGITIKEIARVAKDNNKDWVYNLGLFQRPIDYNIIVNNDERRLVPYYEPRSNCPC